MSLILIVHHFADSACSIKALGTTAAAHVGRPATELTSPLFKPRIRRGTISPLSLSGQGKPTLLSSVEQGTLINPLLDTRQVPAASHTCQFDAAGLNDNTEVFAALRQ